MQPRAYASYPNAPYPNANSAQVAVRYMIPNGYRQNSPPFANQSFDRYASIPAGVRPQYIAQPLRYPPGYRPAYVPPGSTMMPAGAFPRPQQNKPSEQIQPPQQYYYNPYGSNGVNPGASSVLPKKGAKEYKDNAFTIAPDGAHSEAIKGLVSNNDINDLLKHKGTKVKVSKIYRITKTKPDIPSDDSSDEDLLIPPRQPPLKPIQQPLPPPPPPPIQRPSSSSSSSDSHCSTCSNCSCSDCRDRRRSHIYDDCPECRAEFYREQARRQRRR